MRMCPLTMRTLVQITGCRLFGAKPSSARMLRHCLRRRLYSHIYPFVCLSFGKIVGIPRWAPWVQDLFSVYEIYRPITLTHYGQVTPYGDRSDMIEGKIWNNLGMLRLTHWMLVCFSILSIRVYCNIIEKRANADMTQDTVYPRKHAHGFVVLCFVVVMQSFIINSHEVFIHIHQGCFAGTGAIVRLPQRQWSKPDGYGKSVNV